ncbi:hypothetical protein E4U59_000522 [Claviceps monticola]|nr:hypothetical protein E4U59_000522 [Claviceps monticola]
MEPLWWQDLLLPDLNGILLLTDANRPVFHLFTDASSTGIGNFFYYQDDSLDFVPSQDFYTRVAPVHKNHLAVKVLWAGLKPSRRRTYNTAVRSLEAFCAHYGISPWPASFDFIYEWFIYEWLVGRAFSRHHGTIPSQSKILPPPSALTSLHYDRYTWISDFPQPFLTTTI